MRTLTPEQERKFWSKVKKTKGCWLWTGGKNGWGYGYFYTPQKQWRAHILSWVIAGNKGSAGYELHHVCENRACVKPTHLELRRKGRDHKSQHLKDYCIKGHYRRGLRNCRECHKEAQRRYERKGGTLRLSGSTSKTM